MYPMRRSDREQGEEFALSLIDHCSHGVMSIHTSEANGGIPANEKRASVMTIVSLGLVL